MQRSSRPAWISAGKVSVTGGRKPTVIVQSSALDRQEEERTVELLAAFDECVRAMYGRLAG